MIVIAGPCVMESEQMVVDIAGVLKGIASRLGVDLYYKASFDKANRTSVVSYRGPGLKTGLEWLAKAKAQHGVKVDKRKIDIGDPIREVGMREISVWLYSGITTKMKLDVRPLAK